MFPNLLEYSYPIEALPDFIKLINTFNNGLTYEIKIYETTGDYEAFNGIVSKVKGDLPGFIRNYESWLNHLEFSKLQRADLKEFDALLNQAKFLVQKINQYLIKH